MRTFLFSLVGVLYLVFAAFPASFLWYEPGFVRFMDAQQGTAPTLVFDRHIKREAYISYSTVTRDESGDVACEGRGGPFTYSPVDGPLVGKDLVWWSAGDQRCASLPAGVYWTQTCWTVEAPVGDLIPNPLRWRVDVVDGEEVRRPTTLYNAISWLLQPKRVCRDSPPFEIFSE